MELEVVSKHKVERDATRDRGEGTSNQVVGILAHGVRASRSNPAPRGITEIAEEKRRRQVEKATKTRADKIESQGSKPPWKKGTTKDAVREMRPRGNDDAPLVHKKNTVETSLTKQLPALTNHKPHNLTHWWWSKGNWKLWGFLCVWPLWVKFQHAQFIHDSPYEWYSYGCELIGLEMRTRGTLGQQQWRSTQEISNPLLPF